MKICDLKIKNQKNEKQLVFLLTDGEIRIDKSPKSIAKATCYEINSTTLANFKLLCQVFYNTLMESKDDYFISNQCKIHSCGIRVTNICKFSDMNIVYTQAYDENKQIVELILLDFYVMKKQIKVKNGFTTVTLRFKLAQNQLDKKLMEYILEFLRASFSKGEIEIKVKNK